MAVEYYKSSSTVNVELTNHNELLPYLALSNRCMLAIIIMINSV